MSILLICPPVKTVYGKPAMPRLGLAYLSAALLAQDIDHDILDLNLYIQDWRKVLAARLDHHTAFGITSTTFEFKAARQVGQHIKALAPGAPIILGGGAHATLIGQKILSNHYEFDYILSGEGEKILPEFIRLLAKGKKTTSRAYLEFMVEAFRT